MRPVITSSRRTSRRATRSTRWCQARSCSAAQHAPRAVVGLPSGCHTTPGFGPTRLLTHTAAPHTPEGHTSRADPSASVSIRCRCQRAPKSPISRLPTPRHLRLLQNRLLRGGARVPQGGDSALHQHGREGATRSGHLQRRPAQPQLRRLLPVCLEAAGAPARPAASPTPVAMSAHTPGSRIEAICICICIWLSIRPRG